MTTFERTTNRRVLGLMLGFMLVQSASADTLVALGANFTNSFITLISQRLIPYEDPDTGELVINMQAGDQVTGGASCDIDAPKSTGTYGSYVEWWDRPGFLDADTSAFTQNYDIVGSACTEVTANNNENHDDFTGRCPDPLPPPDPSDFGGIDSGEYKEAVTQARENFTKGPGGDEVVLYWHADELSGTNLIQGGTLFEVQWIDCDPDGNVLIADSNNDFEINGSWPESYFEVTYTNVPENPDPNLSSVDASALGVRTTRRWSRLRLTIVGQGTILDDRTDVSWDGIAQFPSGIGCTRIADETSLTQCTSPGCVTNHGESEGHCDFVPMPWRTNLRFEAMPARSWEFNGWSRECKEDPNPSNEDGLLTTWRVDFTGNLTISDVFASYESTTEFANRTTGNMFCKAEFTKKDIDTDNDGTIDADDLDDDGDGMSDEFEEDNELDPLDDSDAAIDHDSDGLTSLEEFEKDPMLDPRLPDTDSDGIGDAFDSDPTVHSNLCDGADAILAGQDVLDTQTLQCAAESSIRLDDTVDIQTGGRLEIIAPDIMISEGFSMPVGAELSALTLDPTPP